MQFTCCRYFVQILFKLPGFLQPALLLGNSPPLYYFAGLANRSSTKNCWQEVIKGKKSGKLANLRSWLENWRKESRLWKLEVGRSRVFGIAQTCDARCTVCGCRPPQGWGIPTWLQSTGRRSMGEITNQHSLTHGRCVGNPLEREFPSLSMSV